jgi:transcriptional regulator with XRE-family HTH domain
MQVFNFKSNGETLMSLGTAIRRLRLEQNLTQRDLQQRVSAQIGHITRGLISNLEAGVNQDPSARVFCGLALALDVTLDRLALEAGYITSTPDTVVLSPKLSQTERGIIRRLISALNEGGFDQETILNDSGPARRMLRDMQQPDRT